MDSMRIEQAQMILERLDIVQRLAKVLAGLEEIYRQAWVNLRHQMQQHRRICTKRRDDRHGLPIATYEMEAEKYIYRVYKYEL